MNTVMDQQNFFSASAQNVLDIQANEAQATTTKNLQQATLTVLSQLGLLAGTGAFKLLNGQVSGSTSTSVALGYSYANEISQSIDAGVTSNFVNNILNNGSNSGAQNQAVTSATQLLQLQLGTQILSQAINTPTLFAQILATLPNGASLGVLNPQSPFSNSFASSSSVIALKTALSQYLTNENITSSDEDNSDIINQAIDLATQNNEISDPNTFQNSLQNSFQQSGLTQSQALSAASFASSYAQSEAIGGSALNSNFTTSNTGSGILSNSLVNNIIVNNGGSISGRDLRDQLAAAFVAQGTTQSDALVAATQAITSNNPTTPFQSTEALQAEIYNKVLSLTSDLGTVQSQQIANSISTYATGQLRDQIGEQLQNLIGLNNQAVDTTLQDNLRANNAPILDSYVLAKIIGRPADALVHTMANGIMYPEIDPIHKNITSVPI